MGPLALAGLGLLFGGLKHFASDVPMANKQRQVQAETTRYSPWTGMKAPEPDRPNLLGSMMPAAFTGASLGQSMENADAYNKMLEAKTAALQAGGGLGGAVPGMDPASLAKSATQNLYSPWQFMSGGR